MVSSTDSLIEKEKSLEYYYSRAGLQNSIRSGIGAIHQLDQIKWYLLNRCLNRTRIIQWVRSKKQKWISLSQYTFFPRLYYLLLFHLIQRFSVLTWVRTDPLRKRKRGIYRLPPIQRRFYLDTVAILLPYYRQRYQGNALWAKRLWLSSFS